MGLQRVTKLVLQTMWIDSVCLGKGERLFKLVYLKDFEVFFFFNFLNNLSFFHKKKVYAIDFH